MTAPASDASTQRAADLALIVGEALAHASTDCGSEVRAITDAMVRLLIGAPLHSDGKLTIVSLAVEAGLRRNKLTHKHTGLKDQFYALVKARSHILEPVSEAARTRGRKQQEALARVRAERDDLRSQAQLLARIVQVLELGNQQLKNTHTALEQKVASLTNVTNPGSRRTSRADG